MDNLFRTALPRGYCEYFKFTTGRHTIDVFWLRHNPLFARTKFVHRKKAQLTSTNPDSQNSIAKYQENTSENNSNTLTKTSHSAEEETSSDSKSSNTAGSATSTTAPAPLPSNIVNEDPNGTTSLDQTDQSN